MVLRVRGYWVFAIFYRRCWLYPPDAALVAGIFIEGGHVFSKVTTSFTAYGDLATCRLKFTNLISELRKPSPRLARKYIKARPQRNPGNHFIKFFRFLGMLTPRSLKATGERSRIDKHGRSFGGHIKQLQWPQGPELKFRRPTRRRNSFGVQPNGLVSADDGLVSADDIPKFFQPLCARDATKCNETGRLK